PARADRHRRPGAAQGAAVNRGTQGMSAQMSDDEAIREAAERIKAAGPSAARLGRNPVNQPMINNWVEAIGDANPVYTDARFAAASVHGGLVAPPAMVQVWTMGGLHPAMPERGDDPLHLIIQVLDE